MAKLRLEDLTPKYGEPDLILSTSKALGSIRDTYTHQLWSAFILNHSLPLFGDDLILPAGLFEALKGSLRYADLINRISNNNELLDQVVQPPHS